VDVDKVVVATGDDGDHVDTDRAHEEPMRVTRSVTMLNAAIEPASVKGTILHCNTFAFETSFSTFCALAEHFHAH